MKVIELTAENFKKLKAIHIKPEGNIQLISGANGQGKTSVLDSIWAALGGSDMTKATGTTQPIREGENKVGVYIEDGEIKN